MKHARQRAPRSTEVSDLASARRVQVRGHRVGTLIAWTDEGPRIDYPGNPHGPLLARSFVPRTARADGQPVLLTFEDERSDRPLLVALAGASPVEAVVDGQRVVLEGREEIVLRCGAASITLRRDGRVVVRGAYVETHADGINRIKGGAVRIN